MNKILTGPNRKSKTPKDPLPINDTIIVNTILNNSMDTLYFKDRESKIIVSSRAHSMLYGAQPHEVVGKTDFDYFPAEFARMAIAVEQRIMETGEPITDITERLERPDGTTVWLSASKYPLYDEEGNIVGTWGVSRDITQLKNTEEELKRVNAQLETLNQQLLILSAKDSLTGLYNQGHFASELDRVFHVCQEDEPHTSFQLVLLDIDNFKIVNDTYGHLVGDCIIRHIGSIIQDFTSECDSSFRHGGDEFAIIVTTKTLEETKELAQEIRHYVEVTPFHYGEKEIQVTVSIGVTSSANHHNANDIVQEADDHLYRSKAQGKNRVT